MPAASDKHRGRGGLRYYAAGRTRGSRPRFSQQAPPLFLTQHEAELSKGSQW